VSGLRPFFANGVVRTALAALMMPALGAAMLVVARVITR
jgi:hypothetical protein